MRRARITYPGAFHHAMNRGYDGNTIFNGNKCKNDFLDLLAASSKKARIRILAYCIMDTHYHIVLENTNGNMSECMKKLNGMYGSYYRKVFGGRGYVFQNRFESTLIEKESYLIQAIVYLLQNPVRAGIVQQAEDYFWSSAKAYFSKCADDIVDAEFINDLFGSKMTLMEALRRENIVLPIRTTKYGEVLGSEKFFRSAVEKFDRRKVPSDQSIGNQRFDDGYFDPVEKVIWEFENMKRIKVDEIDIFSHHGKRQRGELLILLKDNAGLTYKEISKFDIFCDLNSNSLRSIYRNMKKRQMHAREERK